MYIFYTHVLPKENRFFYSSHMEFLKNCENNQVIMFKNKKSRRFSADERLIELQ